MTVESCARHLRTLIQATEAMGAAPFWPAQLDTATLALPGATPSRFPPRCYRWIASPGGSNLYWDLPQVVAARRLSVLTGDPSHGDAGSHFIAAWLRQACSGNGLPLWGNHYFWDLQRRVAVHFAGDETPQPVGAEHQAKYHELRPLPVPWRALAQVDPRATGAALMAMRRHIVGADGVFDRHATVTPVTGNHHAFLEAGAILAEGWAGQGGELASAARMVIAYSAGQRGRSGLLRNSPTKDRWDMHTSTSELGMWAGSVARCGVLLHDRALIDLAGEVLATWLRFAWDPVAGRYRGRLAVDDGSTIVTPRTTEYQPGDWCDVWGQVFPNHDYPMPCAEACLLLHRLTGRSEFADGARQWIRHLAAQGRAQQPALDGRLVDGTCAENYGRIIHFLAEAATVLAQPGLLDQARTLADEAMGHLWTGRMFRGRAGEDRYGAVDGVGILILALLRLETGEDGDLLGFAF